jgi:hypothetical protein
MFKQEDIYEYLMEFDAVNGLDQIWEGLAAKFYLDATSNDEHKLFDVIEKGKQHNITVPNSEMLEGWRFIKEYVEGKVSTPEELEKLINEYGHRTTTSS